MKLQTQIASPNPAIAAKFATFLALDARAQQHARQAAAAYILSGAELLRLHKELGVVPGGDQTVTCDGLLWEDIVGQYAGVSEPSARRRMKMAEAAAGRLPLLQSILDADKPLHELPSDQQIQLTQSLETLTDNQSTRQVMLDWGILSAPKLLGGGPGDKPAPCLPTAGQQPRFATTEVREHTAMTLALCGNKTCLALCSIAALEDLHEAHVTLAQKIKDALEARTPHHG